MAPSSLKKMSGSKGRKEGNYASLKTLPLLACFTSNDLGLTLLPGSQIQKEDERKSEPAARHSRRNIEKRTNQGAEQVDPVGPKKQHKTPARGLPLKRASSRRRDSEIDTSLAQSRSTAIHGDSKCMLASQGKDPPIWAIDDTQCDGSTVVGDTHIKEPQNNAQYGGHDLAQATRHENDVSQSKKRRKISGAGANRILQQIVRKPKEEFYETVSSGAFTEACCNNFVQCNSLGGDSREEMPIYISNGSQKSRFSDPLVQASFSVIPSHMILSKPSVPENACERFSSCASQRPQYKSKYNSSSPRRSHPSAGPPATKRPLSNSTTASRLPTGSECTGKPVPTLQYQQTLKALPVPCLSPPDLRVKALNVVKAVKRSWTSHFPQRYQGPPVSSRASRHILCSSVTPLSLKAKVDNTKPLKNCFAPTNLHEIVATVSHSLSPASLNTATQPAARANFTCEVRVLDDNFDTALASLRGKVSHKRSTSLPNLHSSYHPSNMDFRNACQSVGFPTPPNSRQISEFYSSHSRFQDRTFSRGQDANRESHNVLGSINQFEQASQQLGQTFGGQTRQDIAVVNAVVRDYRQPTHEQPYPGTGLQPSNSQRPDVYHGDQSWPPLHDKLDPRGKLIHNVADPGVVAERVENQAQALIYEKENTWAQQNHTLRVKLEQLERENSELHDRLSQYEPHNKHHCHDSYRHSLHCLKAQLMAAQNENIRIRTQHESLLAALKSKRRKIEDIVGNISKAHSPALQHDSGVGSSNSQQWVPPAISQALPRANNAFTQDPSQSAPQATAYRSPYQSSAAQDQHNPAHHLPPQSQAPQYHVAQYSTAQQLPAREQYPPPEYGPCQSRPPQSFLPQYLSSANPSARYTPAHYPPAHYPPAHYPPAQYPPAYYNNQHHPQATSFQNQTSSAQYPLAHNYTAHVSPAQYSRAQYQSLSSPQGQLAPGNEFSFINHSPGPSPQAGRIPAKKVRSQDVQVEGPSIESVPIENVQAGRNSTEQVQVQDEQVQDAPPGQSPNQPVQAEEVSAKEVRDEIVQAVHAPFEPLRVQEAPAKQTSNMNTQSEGGPTNPIQVDDVPIEVVNVDHSPERELEETASILGGVRANIEAQKTAEKPKRRDWYDGIDPRTMITDNERHLQFGMPSSKKRTATSAFQPLATDGSIAPRATKVAKTSMKKSTKQPKPVLDEAAMAEVARQKKEQQKIYRKKYAEKKKAEKLAQQHESASSTSTTSSHSQRIVERNNVQSPEEASQSSAMQNGEGRASSPIQTWEGMDSLEVPDMVEVESLSIVNGADIPWDTYVNDSGGEDAEVKVDAEKDKDEEVDEDDAALAAELDKALKEMEQEDEVAATQQATAAEEMESSESEESEEE